MQRLPFTQGSLGDAEKGKETLRSFVTDATARTAGKALSLVIVDQEKCFRFELVFEMKHEKGQLSGLPGVNLLIPDLGPPNKSWALVGSFHPCSARAWPGAAAL